MRIKSFRISNFKNLQNAECSDPPDFMVLCGGNGSGKSSILEALMVVNNVLSMHSGVQGYNNPPAMPEAINADTDQATINVLFEFHPEEIEFCRSQLECDVPKSHEVDVSIRRSDPVPKIISEINSPVAKLFGYFSTREYEGPGFFDYFSPYREIQRKNLNGWNALDVRNLVQSFGAHGGSKFQHTKDYLLSEYVRDSIKIREAVEGGKPPDSEHDSLKEIWSLFNRFFAPLEFQAIDIENKPFKFIISTPSGEIDIDDLSSGQKEIFHAIVRFHQFSPRKSIILIDEADAHLHPELQRRYLDLLREVGIGNQVIITTHSPEMMIGAGSESLYTVLRDPIAVGENQLIKVAEDDVMHSVLSEVMGSRGIVSYNRKIVFIEGDESSADRQILEKFYAPEEHNIRFVPIGNSTTGKKVAERVNHLLNARMVFQQFYSIVDGDVISEREKPADGDRLYSLPVYHIENYLLDDRLIFESARSLLGSDCPFSSPEEIETVLEDLLFDDSHLRPYAAALLQARKAKILDEAFSSSEPEINIKLPNFDEILAEAKGDLEEAKKENSWRQICKGRELIRAFCGRFNLGPYKQFRNLLISNLESPPESLEEIMGEILG